MSYRKRVLKLESLDDSQVEQYEDLEIIDSELSAAELETQITEVEFLTEDTETTEALYDKLNSAEEITDDTTNTIIIATEAIANRWCIHKDPNLATESMVAYSGYSNAGHGKDKKDGLLKSIGKMIAELWKRFVEWVGGVIDSIVAGLKGFFSLGKRFQERSKKYLAKIEKSEEPDDFKYIVLRDKDVRLASIDNAPIGTVFWTSAFGHSVEEMTRTLTKWVTEGVVNSMKLIKLTVEQNGTVKRHDTHSVFEEVKSQYKIDGKYFKPTTRKLAKIGPSDDKEEQVVYPVPNNDYVQAFIYEGEVRVRAEETKGNVTREGDTPNTVPYKIAGIRYISASGEHSTSGNKNEYNLKAAMYECFDKEHLTIIAENLGLIGNTLIKHEKSYMEMVKQCKALREQAKKAAHDSQNKELSAYDRACATVANRVARESMRTVSESYRATTALMRNSGKAAIMFLHTSLKAYSKAA